MNLRHLGEGSNSYAVFTDKFDSSLLEKMPRNLGRERWSIDPTFYGYDIWHCRESTFLLDNGIPIAGTLKLRYPSSSEFMVESKSIKLYLNSFDMCKMGKTTEQATYNYVIQIERDLCDLLELNWEDPMNSVRATFHNEKTETEDITSEYHDLYDIIDVENLQIDDYSLSKNHLESVLLPEAQQDTEYEVKVFTNVLRSRCEKTKQKDTGSAYIHIKCSKKTVELSSLLKQIVSLRETAEFHELCSEKLITDIKKVEGVTDVMVMLLYARRGSLDINPVRATKESMIPASLFRVNILTEKTPGQ